MLDDEREIMLYKIASFLRRHAKQEFSTAQIAAQVNVHTGFITSNIRTLKERFAPIYVRVFNSIPYLSMTDHSTGQAHLHREVAREKQVRQILEGAAPNWFDALATPAAPVRDDGEMQAAVARVSQLAEKDLHEKETMVAVIDMIDREEFDRAERALAAYKAQIMSKAELIAEAIAQVRMAKEREVFQWTGEVGEYLGGKSPRTVDRWIAKRIIPQGKRFPGGLFWRKDIIDQWLGADQYATKCAKALKLREATP